eukprot:403356046
MESLMSPQLKTLKINESESLSLYEQVLFQNGQEGFRIWEAGIVIARYIYHNKQQFEGKSILELGSGTGIGGLSALKFAQAQKLIFSDYTQEVLDGIAKNLKLLENDQSLKKSQIYECHLVDWTKEETHHSIMQLKDNDEESSLDFIIATDVIYQGSPYPQLAQLLHKLLNQYKNCQALIIIPDQRMCKEDFLEKMKELGFKWEVEELNEGKYLCKALDNDKESDKYYPGLTRLTFKLYKFSL